MPTETAEDWGKSFLTNATVWLRQPLFVNAGSLIGISLIRPVMGFVHWGLAARLFVPKDVGIASAILSATTLMSGIAAMGLGKGIGR